MHVVRGSKQSWPAALQARDRTADQRLCTAGGRPVRPRASCVPLALDAPASYSPDTVMLRASCVPLALDAPASYSPDT
eukprot:356883-Chlamydomonas_euryale.AAC.1